MFWSEPFSTFVFVEMMPLYETFTVRINWNLYGMNWHCIWMKKVSSYWTDLRYSWTYAVVVKPCEGWLKLSKIFDLIESIDGWVVEGLKFFRLKRKLICFYFRLLCCCFLIALGLNLTSRSLRDNDTVVGTCDRAIKKLERLEISQNFSNQPNLNPNLGGLFRGSFLGVCVWGGGW